MISHHLGSNPSMTSFFAVSCMMRDNHTSRRAFVSYSRRASKYHSAENFFFCSSFIKMSLSCLFPLSKNGIFSSLTKNKKREKKKKKRSWFCRDTYVTTGAMTTRETQQKSRMIGKSDSLWGLIVKNDDICFTHILPRLNRTDLKFLYEVNSETRKLIKRSSRANDLKKGFDVREMSSVSTLEVAWENKPSWCGETYFCYRVAATNKLELLKWAREEKECRWHECTINAAVLQGNLEIVKYCIANECPICTYTCAFAANDGHLECLKYLREEAKAPWDWRSAAWAAKNGHLHILEYLVERKYDKYDEDVCVFAAVYGHFDCLKYLHETAKAPWDEKAVREAHENNHTDCVQYLLDNDCPLPEGWQYEHGELNVPESESE